MGERSVGILPTMAGARIAVLIACIALLAVAPAPCEGKLLKAHIRTLRDFFYLGKFAIGPEGGRLSFVATHVEPVKDATDGKIRLSFYNDESSKEWYWPDIYKSDMSCREKVAHHNTHIKDETGEPRNFTIHSSIPQNLKFSPPKRPHYWYAAASDCEKDDDTDMAMHVQLRWTQDTRNTWYKEFSYEDADLLTLYLVFAIIWGVGFWGVALCAFLLYRKEQWSGTVKIFDTSVFLAVCSLFGYLIHYSVYANDGHGVPAILIISDTFDMLALLMFMTVIFLIAKGSMQHIEIQALKWDFLIVGSLYVLYLIFFMWQELFPFVKPQSNDYKWNSPPGIVMLCIRGALWLYFLGISALSFMREGHAERKYFTLVFATLFSLFFLYLPFMVAIMQGVHAYYRWKTILGIKLCVWTIAFAFICFIQWPTKLANMFLRYAKDGKRLVNDMDDEDDITPYGTL